MTWYMYSMPRALIRAEYKRTRSHDERMSVIAGSSSILDVVWICKKKL